MSVASLTRLATAVPVVVERLSDLARELELTNDELMACLGFIGDVARADELVLLSDVLGISRLVDDQTHAASLGTPSNVLGPFYRPGAPWIANPGSIAAIDEPGGHVIVTGRVSDARAGTPIAGAAVDVWQANAAGRYSNEEASRDPWNLRGRQRTDREGRFTIATVQPAHYTVKDDGPVGQLLQALGRHPWRPAHIHFMITADRYRSLVTQVYIGDGPYLTDDTINGVKSELIVRVDSDRIAFDILLESDPTPGRP